MGELELEGVGEAVLVGVAVAVWLVEPVGVAVGVCETVEVRVAVAVFVLDKVGVTVDVNVAVE